MTKKSLSPECKLPLLFNRGGKVCVCVGGGIFSIDAEKTSDKIPHPFMIEAVSKAGIEKNSFNLIKGIYQKSTAYTIVNDKRQCFPLKIRINNVTEGLSIIKQGEK